MQHIGRVDLCFVWDSGVRRHMISRGVRQHVRVHSVELKLGSPLFLILTQRYNPDVTDREISHGVRQMDSEINQV